MSDTAFDPQAGGRLRGALMLLPVLIWAFGYNLIALPIAASALLPAQGVLLSPPLAALLMALSSITVVVNALMLRVA